MDLHMQSHRYVQRLPDWKAACVAGFVAGAILMVLELLWSTLYTDTGPWPAMHMVAALMLGPGELQTAGFSLEIAAAALLAHYILGVAFGVILACIIAPRHFDSSHRMVAIIGALFGVAMYAFNFYGMARVYTWFVEMRGWPTLVAHLVFGVSAALLYMQMEKRDPQT